MSEKSKLDQLKELMVKPDSEKVLSWCFQADEILAYLDLPEDQQVVMFGSIVQAFTTLELNKNLTSLRIALSDVEQAIYHNCT